MSRLLRRSVAAVRFAAFLLYEIWRSNASVAAEVLRPVDRLHPRIIAVPVDLSSERELVVLSHVITLTPGSLTLAVSEDRKTLFVHAINVEDADALRDHIRSTFERMVRELFA